MPEDYSEAAGRAGSAYLGCPDQLLSVHPEGMSCREQQEALLRSAERDKFEAEIHDITGGVDNKNYSHNSCFCEHFLKGPKLEIFGSRVFPQIRPVCVDDLGTRRKN